MGNWIVDFVLMFNKYGRGWRINGENYVDIFATSVSFKEALKIIYILD